MRLFHFSDRGDIAEYVPRPPERHPEAEPFVYAIDDWHAPLYLFPRDCPRIGVWPVENSRPEDVSRFRERTDSRMRLLIDARFADSWREEGIYRYEFNPEDGFVDCHDHGVFVSKETVVPVQIDYLDNLPYAMESEGIQVEVVESLADAAKEFFDFERREFRTSLHVSMVRMSLLPDWKHQGGKPTRPKDV